MDDLDSLSIELPQELILTEILPRLPVKSLIRFKSVSKLWNSIISSPLFAHSHLKHLKSSSTTTPTHSLLLYSDSNSFFSFNYESTHLGSDPKSNLGLGLGLGLIRHEFGGELLDELDIDFYNQVGVFIVGSCDGIVCVEFGNTHLYLWNPATGESRRIENPASYRKKETIWGFGYVSKVDDYKIVSVSQKLHSHRKKAHTLSVRGGGEENWVKVGIPPDGYNLDSRTYGGVVVDDMVFWRMTNGVGGLCVMGFDLDKECFEEVPVPDWMTALGDFTVWSMAGCLCVWWRNSEESRVEIAVAKRYGGEWESWEKLYSFGCESFYCCDLLGSARLGKVVVVTLDGTFLYIDLNEESPAFVELLTLPSKDVVNHIDSLVSPFGVACLGNSSC